jgi:hypothetical protein
MKKYVIFVLTLTLSTVPVFSQMVKTSIADKEVKSTSVVQPNNAISGSQSFNNGNLFFKQGSLLLNTDKGPSYSSMKGNDHRSLWNNTFARADYYFDMEKNLLPLKFSNMIYYRVPRPRYEYSLIANY